MYPDNPLEASSCLIPEAAAFAHDAPRAPAAVEPPLGLTPSIASTAPKSPRGVQQADVWAAADALLAQGLRPTIERVRLHLGRGSPNTVSPLLEGWFASLGQRLRLAGSPAAVGDAKVHTAATATWVDTNVLGDVPAAVVEPALQSLRQLWAVASSEAAQLAQAALAQRQASLEGQEQALQANLADLAQREAALKDQKRALDEALLIAQQQAQQLAAQLQDMQLAAHERQAHITQLSAQLERERSAHVQALAHEREQHAQALAAAHAERERVLEQSQGNERRLLLELDRTRQDAQRQRQHLEGQIQSAQSSAQQTQAKLDDALAQLQQLHTQHSQATQAAAHAAQRAQQLQTLLDQHLAAQTHVKPEPPQKSPNEMSGVSAPRLRGLARGVGMGATALRRAPAQRSLRKGRG